MATKNVTLRLPEDIVKFLNEERESINAAVIKSIDSLRTIRKYSTNELKGKFDPKEWLFFADVLNGTFVDGMLRGNADALVASCKDAEELDGTAQKHDIDIDALTNKIKKLTAAQVEALYNRIEKYWNLADLPKDLETENQLEHWENF